MSGRSRNIGLYDMRHCPEAMRLRNRLYAALESAVEESVLSKKKSSAASDAESIGERLARLRKEKGITQVELAKMLDTTQPVVSDYERGLLRLHGELIVQLAGILEVSADELLGLEQLQRPGPARDRRLARRLQAFDKLPKRDRDTLTRTVDAFLERAQVAG
ncbi:MAG: helix-turn-helix domain-containing protein [Myxococcaceae bacterium]|nr:helix-turn-helix domain-containing protein [Myxococcaceae bacterium]